MNETTLSDFEAWAVRFEGYDLEKTSAMRTENPYAASSFGKLSAGRMSTPSNSRTVLLYSVLFNRRAVTRPGSGLAFRSCRANSFSKN